MRQTEEKMERKKHQALNPKREKGNWREMEMKKKEKWKKKKKKKKKNQSYQYRPNDPDKLKGNRKVVGRMYLR